MTYIFIYALVLGAASHDVDGFLECNCRNADVGLALIVAWSRLTKGKPHWLLYSAHIIHERRQCSTESAKPAVNLTSVCMCVCVRACTGVIVCRCALFRRPWLVFQMQEIFEMGYRLKFSGTLFFGPRHRSRGVPCFYFVTISKQGCFETTRNMFRCGR